MSDSDPPQTAASSDNGTPLVKRCPQCELEYSADTDFCPKDGSTLVTPGATGLEGRIIAGRYRVLRQIGEGGMGRVYLAEHIKMGRRCAFKVLAHALVSDAEAIGRFNREAMNASRILHPNVAAVYDFGEASDGLVYLAMELVEGEPLSAVCARATVLSAERTIDIASQVAEGLTPAHELGIVHRDLKPDNIIVGTAKDGRDVVKIIDFGIAKGMAGDTQRVTRTGFIVGTPEYMSPEQLAGDTLDGRSDLFALGCVMYRMLTGESTFTGPSMESQIQRRLTRPPPHARAANPAVPPWLDAVVAKAMERDPGDRYQTATEFRDALRGGAVLRTARRKAIAMPVVSRRFWFAAGAVAGVTLLVSLGMRGEHAAPDGHAPSASGGADSARVAPPRIAAQTSSSAQAGANSSSGKQADSGTPVRVPVPPASPAPRAPDAHRDAPRVASSGTQRAPVVPTESAESRVSALPPPAPATSHAAPAPGGTPAMAANAPSTPANGATTTANGPTTTANGPTAATAPPPPVAPPLDVAGIQAAVTRYARALESRDLARVRAAYPALTDEQAHRWKDVFDATNGITATLTVVPPAHVSDSDMVAVNVKAAFSFDYKRGVNGDPNPTATYHANLSRSGSTWVLRSIE